MKTIRILCLSGSLRKSSYNTAVIRALSKLAASDIDVVIFSKMKDLPLFNPDREEEDIPVVRELCNEIKIADGLIIASPEYAHGISGVIKNALDWLVGGPEFSHIPVALINTSPRAAHAQRALKEVIKTMSGQLFEQPGFSVPLLGTDLDDKGIMEHPKLSITLTEAVSSFAEVLRHHLETSELKRF